MLFGSELQQQVGPILVISSTLLSEASVVLDQPAVRHELVRLAAAMETSDHFSPAPLATSKAVRSVDSFFPLAGYLNTSTAKLISWHSLRVLGKVALSTRRRFHLCSSGL